jgi:hypothetical protein
MEWMLFLLFLYADGIEREDTSKANNYPSNSCFNINKVSTLVLSYTSIRSNFSKYFTNPQPKTSTGGGRVSKTGNIKGVTYNNKRHHKQAKVTGPYRPLSSNQTVRYAHKSPLTDMQNTLNQLTQPPAPSPNSSYPKMPPPLHKNPFVMDGTLLMLLFR